MVAMAFYESCRHLNKPYQLARACEKLFRSIYEVTGNYPLGAVQNMGSGIRTGDSN